MGSGEDLYLCWSDLTKALRRRWPVIRLVTVLFGAVFFLFALVSPPLFSSTALFYVKGKRDVSSSGFGNVLQLASGASGGQDVDLGLSLMESRSLGETVIRATGLQIIERPEGKSLRLLRNLKDNLIGEIASWANWSSRVTANRNPPWIFRHVVYEGLASQPFTLQFEGDGVFTCELGGKKARGKVGEPFCSVGIRFTLDIASEAVTGRRVKFLAQPMFRVYQQFKRNLQVKASRRKDSAISIVYNHFFPRESVEVINTLMNEYLRLAKINAREVADEQIRFLARAQETAWDDLSECYDEYVDFIKKGIEDIGFVRTKDALKLLTQTYGEYSRKLQELEQEAKGLKVIDPVVAAASHSVLKQHLANYSGQLHDLSVRKNSLELALREGEALPHEIRQHLDSLEKERGVHLELVKQFEEVPDQKYLESLIASSSFRRRVHAVKLGASLSPPNEMQGLGLHAATENYKQSLEALRRLEAQGTSLEQAMAQLTRDEFDVGALIDTLGVGKDFVTKVSECHELGRMLRDVKNYSAKELGRIQEAFARKRLELREYLTGVRSVNLAQLAEARKYIRQIQLGLFGLVFKETALVEEEMRRVVEQRSNDLKNEIDLTKAAIAKLKKEMASLPQAWLKEKKLNLRTDVQAETMRSLSGLAESRHLSSSLDIAESRPIDPPFFPVRPKSPGLLLWASLGALCGFFLSSIYALGSAALAGFIATRDNLRVRGQFVSNGSGRKGEEEALFHTTHRMVYCTGLSSEEFFSLAQRFALQGERTATLGRSADVEGCDHKLRRLHPEEISAKSKELGESIDRLLVYIPGGPLGHLVRSFMQSAGDWIVSLSGERVRDLAPYFDISQRARVAFLFSKSL